MGVTIATVQTTCDTAGGGTQDITTTDLGGLTPVAAMVFISGATSLDTAADHARIGIGFTDGTNELAFSVNSEHGVATTDTHRRAETDEIVSIMDTGDFTIDGEANFNSFITNGIRITWGDYPASAYYMTWVFFAGTDVSAHCNTFAPNATEDATVDVTDPGFEPDAVLFAWIDRAIPTLQTEAIVSFGAAVNDGADTQASKSWFSQNNQGTSSVRGILYDHYAFNISTSRAGEIGTFDANGFTCTTRLGAISSSQEVGYLALAFNSVITAGLDILTTPTSTGNQAFTVSLGGETPQLCLMTLTKHSAVDTLAFDSQGGTVGFYTCDADDEASQAWQDEDNQGTTDAQSYAAAKATLDDHDGTGMFDASFVSFAANTVTLNFAETDGTARKWWCVSFGTAAGGPTLSVSEAVAVAESTSAAMADDLAPSASEVIGIQDTPILGVTRTLSVSEAVGVTDTPTAAVIDEVPIEVSVSEAVSVVEAATVAIADDLAVSVSDVIGIQAEAITVFFVITMAVSETVAVAEATTVAQADALAIDVSEAVSVAESVTQDVTRTVSVSEAVAVAESVTVTVPPIFYGVAVSDAVAVAESVTLQSSDLALSISDGVAVADSPSGVPDTLEVTASEAVAIAESVTNFVTGLPYSLSSQDTVAVAESVTVAISAVAHTINVSESVTLVDAPTIAALAVILSVSESISVSESFSFAGLVPVLLDVAASDAVVSGASMSDAVVSGVTLSDSTR
jgi:hypothetical protein